MDYLVIWSWTFFIRFLFGLLGRVLSQLLLRFIFIHGLFIRLVFFLVLMEKFRVGLKGFIDFWSRDWWVAATIDGGLVYPFVYNWEPQIEAELYTATLMLETVLGLLQNGFLDTLKIYKDLKTKINFSKTHTKRQSNTNKQKKLKRFELPFGHPINVIDLNMILFNNLWILICTSQI